MALRCGEQFRRRYIGGEVIPPSIAAGRGTAVHKANKVNLKAKVVGKRDLPLADLQDVTRDAYVQTFQSAGVYIPKEELPAKERLLNDGLNDALRCTKIYKEEVAPQINPVEIEKPFEIDVGLDLPLAGRMDYQEEPRVGDIKTTSLKWQENRIEKEIQPVFYSYVHEKETGIRPEFVYHILIARRNKKGAPTSEGYQIQKLKPSMQHYKALFAKLELMIRMLKTGVFPPTNPTNWVCSPKWCGYWHTCEYVGNSLPKKWI
jgi:hypothetical protein